MAAPKSFINTYLERALANAQEADLVAAGYPQQNDPGATGIEKGARGITQTMFATFFRIVRDFFAALVQSLLPVLAILIIAITTHFLPDLTTARFFWSSPFVLAVFGTAVLAGLFVTGRTAILLSRRLRGVPLFPRLASRSQFFLAPPAAQYAYMLISNLFTLLILVLLALPFDIPLTWLTWILALAPVVVVVVVLVSSSLIRGLLAIGMSQRAKYGEYPVPTQQRAAQFDERVARLQQMREWLQDERLRELVDDAIGQQVRSVARRQILLSIILSITSLVVGWLLSAISPSFIGKLF